MFSYHFRYCPSACCTWRINSNFNFLKLKNTKYSNNVKDACKDADLIVLHTEWDEFKSLDFKSLVKKKNFKIFDMRNLYNFDEMIKKKIKYFSIGRRNVN